MAKIFLTGITGFLGSNIAHSLLATNNDIIAICRSEPSNQLLKSFEKGVTFILLDDKNEWQNEVIAHNPEIVIHAAWLGVGHLERDDWEVQLQNVDFLKKLLTIAERCKVKKIISLGSQAEYGSYNGCINEEHELKPVEAYGCVKIICSELLKQYCNYYQISWYWLRLFSFFGKGEADNWLIPSVVKKMIINNQMDFTAGEQKYAYLYVEDLGIAINKIITIDGKRGIYNVSGKNVIMLKKLIELIRDIINPKFLLNFGALPYRENQSMHMQGNCFKFESEFGVFETSNFEESLFETVNHLKAKYESI
jgi:nucleoside-diphosphate-sugar epimerase